MTNVRDFKAGDRVDGPIGSGTVTKIENGMVHVTYHHRGGDSHGIYDDNWFRLYPDMLKHAERAR